MAEVPVDTHVDMHIDMCVDMHVDMHTNVRVDMHIDMHIDMHEPSLVPSVSDLGDRKGLAWYTRSLLCEVQQDCQLQPQLVNGQQSKPLKTCSQQSYWLRNTVEIWLMV